MVLLDTRVTLTLKWFPVNSFLLNWLTMGQLFTSKDTTRDQYKDLTAQAKLNIILSLWLRECNIPSSTIPTEIKELLINVFLYQPHFDVNYNNENIKQKQYDHLFKLVIAGDPQVGRTMLYERYTDDPLDNFIPSIRINFRLKNITINGKIIKLQIWDYLPDDPNDNIDRGTIFRGAHGVLLCYDITNKVSLCYVVRKWNDLCEENANSSLIAKLLVGCKCDDVTNRICTKQNLMDVAKECGIDAWIETSATRNINVGKAFDDIAAMILPVMEKKETYPFYG